jgi:carbamoyltransferase
LKTIILGISAFYHDSAAALIVDGEIVSAAQEERFTRKKHDSSFPVNAIRFILDDQGLDPTSLNAVAFYEKPFIKFERLLETYHAFAPSGLQSFLSFAPIWIKEKLFLKNLIRKELKSLGVNDPVLLFPEHHLSHAASAFYPSPFEETAILTVDGVGEWATCTIGYGHHNQIKIIKELHFPHSIGLLYSAFTYYTGFQVNEGEYKLMGLAPYGNPASSRYAEYKKLILDNLVDVREDGSVLLNMKYFRFATGLRMVCDNKWEELFGIPPRKPESAITQEYMDMALAIQEITDEIIYKLAKTAKQLTGKDYLVMAGGVALNSVANGKLLSSGLFKDIWIQPASGDAGGAVGAALSAYCLWAGRNRDAFRYGLMDGMQGALLGPEFSDREIERELKRQRIPHKHYEDFNELARLTAEFISKGKVVGWFQGRMEFGPRALGNRSILADARDIGMQKRLNLKIKFREGFRPFAPAVLEEDASQYFDTDRSSPYMLFVVPVKHDHKISLPPDLFRYDIGDRLSFPRSDIPSVTHLDYSARIQTVNKKTNPRFWQVIHEFKKITGCPVIINTSFNVRGEPIVCTPEDAIMCYTKTGMDVLVMGNYLITLKP